MKKTIMAVAAICCLAACNKEKPAAGLPGEEERYDLKVSVASALTKVTDALDDSSDEKKVNTLDVFVFKGDVLDAYAQGTGVTELTLSCSAGERTVYAFANMGDLHEIATLTQARALAASFSESGRRNLQMFGECYVSLPSASSVNVELRRVASRVVIKKITRNFSVEALSYQSMTIDAVYMINVIRACYLYGNVIGQWHNQGGWNNEYPELLYDSVGSSIADGTSLSVSHYFYPFPNPGTDRKTLLVIKATLAGSVCYYPIALPALESNKSYEISEIVLTRPGSTTEDEPITSDNATFSVTVKDWVTQTVTVESI